MAKGTPTKSERNAKIVALKKTMTFAALARRFRINETRVKQIYYRALGNRGRRRKKPVPDP
jgi:hypothetical protein